jgi:Cu/Ag efflux protein CusF
MDMPFKVNDMSLLKGVKTGDKVHFFISVTTDVNGHGEYIIVDLEKE